MPQLKFQYDLNKPVFAEEIIGLIATARAISVRVDIPATEWAK